MLGALVLTQLCVRAQTDTAHLYTDSTAAKQYTLSASDTTIRYRINKKFIGSLFTDLAYEVSRPAHWHGKDFKRLGLVVGGAGLLATSDYTIKTLLIHNQTNFMTSVTNQIEPFGNAYSPYLIGGMYLIGVIAHDRKLESASLMTAKSVLISTLIYVTAKSVIRRGRPAYGDDPFSFDPAFSMNKTHTSFPSGHMLTVTTVATSLAELYGKEHPWVPWVTYTIAGLTGVTRMYQNRHWSSDVWIGASLGYFVTKSIFRHHRMLEHQKAVKLMAAGM
jgi:membrane-associated phospholipid phosphatase